MEKIAGLANSLKKLLFLFKQKENTVLKKQKTSHLINIINYGKNKQLGTG
jgi:hypothetical protein